MLWQPPPYFIITFAEIMFSITGLSFCYNQAPHSMKTFVQALWLLCVAIGNAIVTTIAKIDFFDEIIYELLLFAALMALDMLVFIYNLYRSFYKLQITNCHFTP